MNANQAFQRAVGASKKFTKDSLNGLGALVGAPCTIKSTVKVADGVEVTFGWTGNDGSTKTTTILVSEGPKGPQGIKGLDGMSVINVQIKKIGNDDHLLCTVSDGTPTGVNVIDAGIISNSGQSTQAKWGQVTGTIDDQLDLKNKFAQKADAADLGDIRLLAMAGITNVIDALNALDNKNISSLTINGTSLEITLKDGSKYSADISAIVKQCDIGDLNDVDDTGITDGQVLAYDVASNMYKPKDVSGANVLQQAKNYTDSQIALINQAKGIATDAKPTYTGGTTPSVTYTQNGTSYTTTDFNTWFYYKDNGDLCQTIWIDGVELTIKNTGAINLTDYVNKNTDLATGYVEGSTDVTKVATISELNDLIAIINNKLSTKVNKSDVIDDYVHTDTDKPASARVAKELKDLIDNVSQQAGSGTVKAVNNVAPNAVGNVVLTIDDVPDGTVRKVHKTWVGTKADLLALGTYDDDTEYKTTDEEDVLFLSSSDNIQQEIYSLQEVKIGEWLGKDLFMKVVPITALDNVTNNTNSYAVRGLKHGIQNVEMTLDAKFIEHNILFNRTYDLINLTDGFDSYGIKHIGLGRCDNNEVIIYFANMNKTFDFTNNRYYLVIKYTKGV